MGAGSDSDRGLTLQNASACRTMPSAERRAPSAERRASNAARPDRRLPRRGGGSSPFVPNAASAAGRSAGPARPRLTRRGLARSARALAAAVLLALSGALALPATAQAQNVSRGRTFLTMPRPPVAWQSVGR